MLCSKDSFDCAVLYLQLLDGKKHLLVNMLTMTKGPIFSGLAMSICLPLIFDAF